MFDMDKMREEILAEEQKTAEQNLSQNKETVTHRSDALIAKKRRELKDIPVVSASSLLSPDEARKLRSFTTKSESKSHPKTRDDGSKGDNVNKNRGHQKKKNHGDSIDDNDDVEIDIDSDMSDDEIEYLKKKKRLERETIPEPAKTSGRYEASAMFSREPGNSTGENDKDDTSDTRASSISFETIKSFVNKHVNLQLLYFSAVALFRQAKKFLEDYKMIVWLVLSFLLVYKFLF
eukprot:g5999.t1